MNSDIGFFEFEFWGFFGHKESLRAMMLNLLMFWAAIGLMAGQVCAQVLGGVVTAESASGQFTVRTVDSNPFAPKPPGVVQVPMGDAWAFLVQPPAAPATAEVKLVPALLTVSCDRIKSALLMDLGMGDEWRGKIDLFINPSRLEDQGALLTLVRVSDGWQYELQLPQEMKPEALTRAVVEALLMEIANRSAGDQSAEIPLWLLDGLSAHLQSYNLPTFIVQPQVQLAANKFTLPQQDAVRDQLRHDTPLTFQQLSLPAAENVDGEHYHLYSNCAQLFVEELLRFPDGRRCLRQMMEELAHHLNWQTAFLLGFRPHFADLRGVEKWWGLVCAGFCDNNFAQRSGLQVSWRKIQDALDVPVEVHLSPDQLPTAAEITLEEVVSDWTTEKAAPVLEHCIQNLSLLRRQVAPELVPVVDGYQLALQEYLRASQTAGATLAYKKAVCRRLRLLDEQRELLRKKMAAAK